MQVWYKSYLINIFHNIIIILNIFWQWFCRELEFEFTIAPV